MKNVSKLALFVAAGMLSAGANANTIVLAEEGTSLSLSGGVESNYIVDETVDSSLDSDEDNQSDLEGEVTLGVTAERSFGDFDGYVEIGYSYDTQNISGSKLASDGAAFGFTGDFGQIELGETGSVYDDEIIGAIDIFEQAGPDGSGNPGVDEGNMITYYSPSTNGFSFNLQAGVEDEAENTDSKGSTDTSFNVSSAYDFGAGSVHLGYNEVDFTGESDVLGIAAIFQLGLAEISLAHEMESIDSVDTDYTSLTVTAGYGPGDIYAGFYSTSPDAAGSDDLSQYAVGINAEIADGLSAYAEYGDFDGTDADDKDTVMAVGFAYDF
jgi:predicted porin